MKTYVGQEQIVQATGGPANIRLEFDRLDPVHSLMLRNTDELGNEAHFRVISLRSYAGVASESVGTNAILKSGLKFVCHDVLFHRSNAPQGLRLGDNLLILIEDRHFHFVIIFFIGRRSVKIANCLKLLARV